MCSAISFLVALTISTLNICTICPGFNLPALERQKLYKKWPYMQSLIICPCLYNSLYWSSTMSCSRVHWIIYVRMCGCFGPQFLSMKSLRTFKCITSVYDAGSCLEDSMKLFPFDTKRITTMKVVSDTVGKIHIAVFPMCSPKSIAHRLLPCLALFHASSISHAHFFPNISTNTGESIPHYDT